MKPSWLTGAVREQELEVVLAQRAQSADEHRGGADDQHQPAPTPREGEHRCQARHQVDARLHHRGRVQVRAHRRRRNHRRGQPTAERRLRGLGERTEQDQYQTGVHRAARRWVDQQFGDPVRPAGLTDDDQPRHHRQAAGAGDEDRLERRGPGTGVGVVVADQEVRRDRGEFPEDEQRDELIRQDHPEHRPGEQRQHAGEAREAGLVVAEVAERVHADQQSDAGHERDHHEREGVESEVDRDPELFDPRERLGHRLAVDDSAGLRSGPDHRRQRRDRGDQEGPVPQRASTRDDADADGEVEDEEEEHRARPTLRGDAGWPADLRAPATARAALARLPTGS